MEKKMTNKNSCISQESFGVCLCGWIVLRSAAFGTGVGKPHWSVPGQIRHSARRPSMPPSRGISSSYHLEHTMKTVTTKRSGTSGARIVLDGQNIATFKTANHCGA